MSKPNAEFIALMGKMMASYGKGLPDAPVLQAWWDVLAPFNGNVVQKAFSAYAIERPDFAPVPNSIAARCRLLDGRPSDDEAWSLALSSRDERETVVWTEEMASAFAQCQNVLALGDEVGARMAFKDAYNRMVAEARAQGRPAVWSVSPGWDAERRAIAVNRALTAGLLEAPKARLLLPNGQTDGEAADTRPEGLQRVLAALRELESPVAKAERISQARMDEEKRRTEEIAQQVAAYRSDKDSPE